MSPPTRTTSPALIWLTGCLLTGLALVFLYPDSYQQDGPYHHLGARWAWVHRELFVGVWQRPLFSVFHALPALGGYGADRLFSALLSTLGAAFTWRAARRLGVAEPWRVIPFYLLQPALFLMWSDTMTEPLFATVLAAALWAHVSERRLLGAVLASLLIGVRPEGAFVALVWGLMMLGSRNYGEHVIQRGFKSLVLATGLLLWCLAAWALSGDPLYLIHHWPSNWSEGAYGTGPIWSYVILLPEIVGPLLLVPVLIGLVGMVRAPRLRLLAALVLFTFAAHSVMRVLGMFGSAGYARYFSAFAPCLAVAGCLGWNRLVPWLSDRVGTRRVSWVWRGVVVVSFVFNLCYVDAQFWNRDAWAVRDMTRWFEANEDTAKVKRLVWSQAAMCIEFGRDPREKPGFPHDDRAASLAIVRDLPPGTLVFWDALTGVALHQLAVEDFLQEGFRVVHQKDFALSGWFSFLWADLFEFRRLRHQTMYFLIRDDHPPRPDPPNQDGA